MVLAKCITAYQFTVCRRALGALLDLECVDPALQLPGVDQRPQNVVVQVPESQGDAAQMFQPSVDGLDRAVRRSHIEVRQDVVPSAPQGPAELCQLLQPCR